MTEKIVHFPALVVAVPIFALVLGLVVTKTPVAVADDAPVESRDVYVEPRGVIRKLQDTTITFKISNVIVANESVSTGAQVNVTTVNSIVLLTGNVKTAGDKQWCESAAKEFQQVRKVINELKVQKQRSLWQVTKDKALQTKTKFRLVKALGDDSPTVSVVVYRGTVYLMGVVSKNVAEQATELARTTKSVERVITIFEFKKDTKDTGPDTNT